MGTIVGLITSFLGIVDPNQANPNSMLGADHYDNITKKFWKNSKGDICVLTDREAFVQDKLHKKDTYILVTDEKDYNPAMKVLFGTEVQKK